MFFDRRRRLCTFLRPPAGKERAAVLSSNMAGVAGRRGEKGGHRRPNFIPVQRLALCPPAFERTLHEQDGIVRGSPMPNNPHRQQDPQPSAQKKAGRRSRKLPVDEKIPSWLEAYGEPMTKNNVVVEDLVWIGDDGSLDPHKLLETAGYESKGPLWILLDAIVSANCGDGRREQRERVAIAEAALLGRTRKAGNQEIQDEARLIEIGKRYFKLWVQNREIVVELGPLAEEVLKDPRFAPGREGTLRSVVRRLQRKFKSDRDRILARATADLRYETPQFYTRILNIISELKALGLEVDEDIVRERMRLGEPKAAD